MMFKTSFTISCTGVCLSRSLLEHCGHRTRDQCRRGNAQFIRAHRHRHHHQSGSAVDGTANPRLLPGLWPEWDWDNNNDPASVTGWPVWHARPQLFLRVCIQPHKFRHSRPSSRPHPPIQNPQPSYPRGVCEWGWRCWCVSKCVCLNCLFVDMLHIQYRYIVYIGVKTIRFNHSLLCWWVVVCTNTFTVIGNKHKKTKSNFQSTECWPYAYASMKFCQRRSGICWGLWGEDKHFRQTFRKLFFF